MDSYSRSEVAALQADLNDERVRYQDAKRMLLSEQQHFAAEIARLEALTSSALSFLTCIQMCSVLVLPQV
jgi:hypothetical protein